MINSLDRKRFVLLALITVIAASLLVIYLSWPFLNVIILSLFGAYVLRPLDRTDMSPGALSERAGLGLGGDLGLSSHKAMGWREGLRGASAETASI